jgi:tetraacyldisaccharide 4'-kinase
MNTPLFFYQKSLISILLLPLSALFFISTLLRNCFIKPKKIANKFVICVGNVTVGGAGKTPSAILLAKLLKSEGLKVCFLSRGYGRKSKGFKCLSSNMNAEETGDEPRLLLEVAPVYLFSSYREIIANQSLILEDVIIMDDGFQNPSIIKDFNILVVDGKLKFGNGFLLPAGALREPVSSALSRANAVFNIEGEGVQTAIPEFILTRSFYLSENWRGGYLAFSGLAINQKFFSSLEKLGLKVEQKLEFKDHHFYTRSELEKIIMDADKKGLKPITTEKDFVKIPHDLQPKFCVLKMELLTSEGALLQDVIKNQQKNKDLA